VSGRTISSPLILWNSILFPASTQGREGLKQVIAAFRIAFPDILRVIEEMVAEGDHVFSRFSVALIVADLAVGTQSGKVHEKCEISKSLSHKILYFR